MDARRNVQRRCWQAYINANKNDQNINYTTIFLKHSNHITTGHSFPKRLNLALLFSYCDASSVNELLFRNAWIAIALFHCLVRFDGKAYLCWVDELDIQQPHRPKQLCTTLM